MAHRSSSIPSFVLLASLIACDSKETPPPPQKSEVNRPIDATTTPTLVPPAPKTAPKPLRVSLGFGDLNRWAKEPVAEESLGAGGAAGDSPDANERKAKSLPRSEFEKFVALFPEAKLPQAFDRGAKFEVGDIVPEQFGDLVGGAPSDFRIGVRLPMSSGAVALTLLHLPTGKLELHTFTADGAPAKYRTIAHRKTEMGTTEDSADGTGRRKSSAKSTETLVTDQGLLEGKSFEGEEITHYVKKHLDGSRPVSRIECTISGATWTDSIDKWGNFLRKNAKIVPTRSTTDAKGCQGAWPL